MLSTVSPLFFRPSKWVLCASKRRTHQSSLTFQTTGRTDTTGPWGKVAVKLVSFSTRRSLCRTSPALWTHNTFAFPHNCICSYHASHAGVDESNRVSFWQDLVASTAHVVSVLPHSTFILSGDANVWHSHFSLDRMRSRDNAIFPYIQHLLDMALSHPQSTFACHTHGWCSVGYGVCFQQFGVFTVHCPSG